MLDRVPRYIDKLNNPKMSQFLFGERQPDKVMHSFRNA